MRIAELHGGGYSAKINLSRGGNCISLRHDGMGISILREPDYSAPIDNPFLYGMPILFPVNRISGGNFAFDGRGYVFPINEANTGCHLHGELHCAEFECVDQTANSIVCRFSAKEYGGIPHSYSIILAYALNESGLTLKTGIHNHSELAMPIFLGFHTTFNTRFVQGGDALICAQVSELVERNAENYLPTGRLLPADMITDAFNRGEFVSDGHPISRHYRAFGSGMISLTDHLSSVRIVYENDTAFAWRLIYNGDANGFICLEPQTCMVNCQNSEMRREETGFISLAPGELREFTSHIYAESLQTKGGSKWQQK